MKAKIILFVVATIWIEYNYIPIIPIGFLVVLFWVRPKSIKKALPFVIAILLGLIGTGVSLQFFHLTKVNPNTQERYELSKFNLGFNLGTKNITRFLNRDVIKLYQDNIYAQQQERLDNYLRGIVPRYNANQTTTPLSSLYEKYGKIEDMYHFGNLNYFVPDIYKKDVLFVYKIKFEKSPKEQTIHLRTLFYDDTIEIAQTEVMPPDTKYDVRQRIVTITPYKERTP